MTTLNKLLGLAAGLALAVGATGCSQPTPSPAPSGSEQPPSDAHVVLWHTMTGVNAAALDEVINGYNTTVGKERGITVESVFQGDDTADKLKTLSQSGDIANFPDIVMIPGPGVPSTMTLDPFVPIQRLLDDDVPDTIEVDDFEPNMVTAVSYKGEMMTMPYNNSTLLLYYNKDAFTAAGLDPNAPPATMAELADAAKALVIREGDEVKRWGLNVEVRRYHMSNFIGGQGEYTFFGNNEGGRAGMMTEVTFGQDGTMSKFLTEWGKVVGSGGYKPIEDNINEEFATELTAMTLLSTARIATIKNLVGDSFEWGVAPLPKVDPTDTGGAAIGGNSLGIFDRGIAGNVQAAWDFLQYAASPEVQVKWHISTGYIPVNVHSQDLPELQEHLKANPAYQVAIDQMHSSHRNVQEPFDIINWDVDAIIRDAMREFGSGNLSAADAENQMVTKINESLAAYARANA